MSERRLWGRGWICAYSRPRDPRAGNVARLALVIVITSFFAWFCAASCRAEGCSREERSDRIDAALNDGHPWERRRAVLALALEGGHNNRVVDTVVCDRVECYLAIRMAGKDAAERLRFRLLEPTTRSRSLHGLALLAPLDLRQNTLQERLQERATADETLDLILRVLDCATSPQVPASDAEALAKRLSDATWDSDMAAIYRAGVMLQKTRPWALAMVRSRLGDVLARLEREDADQKDLFESENEVFDLILCLLCAARSGSLEPADVAIMKRALDTVVRLLDEDGPPPFEPAILWAQWLGRGKRELDLKKALRCSGSEDPPYGFRFLHSFNELLGDTLLEPADIPLLIRHATDETLDDDLRVGAIRVLGYLGAVDNAAHDAFMVLIGSDREAVRLAAAVAISQCVEDDTRYGRLLAAVEERLRAEGSLEVASALNDAAKHLKCF